MSLAVYSEFTVVTVAPARRIPWNRATNAAEFGECSATTSPGRTPRAARAPATARTWSTRSPYVTVRSPSTTATVRSSSGVRDPST